MTSSPFTPDDSNLLEFADAVNAGGFPQPRTDLERTYLHVHTTMKGESGAIPSDLKQSTWDDVMSTLSMAPERPVSNRTRRNTAAVAPPKITSKRMRWSPLASVALAAVLVLASIGVWRGATLDNDSTRPAISHVAGLSPTGDPARLLATPENGETTAINRSVPIVLNVDTQPMDGPVIWLTTTGEVMYDDGQGEVQTIATGATQVMPQATNVIRISGTLSEDVETGKDGTTREKQTSTYYHLITGKTLVDDGTFSSYLSDQNLHLGSLTVLTIADAPREWSIVNFDTMESKSISELTGGNYPSSESISVTVSDDFSTIAIATSQYQSEDSSILMRQSGLPGEVAVIPSDLTGASWVSVPEGLPPVTNISLTPDGSKIAFIASDRSFEGTSMIVSVVEVATSEEIARTEQIDSMGSVNFQWATGSNAFIVVSGSHVKRYSLDGSAPTVLLESAGTIRQLPRMEGSSLVYLQVSSVPLDTSTPVPATTHLVILNPATGESITVDGMPWYTGASYPVQISTSLAPIPVSQDGKTAMLVHPITGKIYTEVIANVDDPVMRPDFEPEEGVGYYPLQTVTTALRAPVSVVELANGNLAIVKTTEDSFDVRTVERPAGAEDLQLGLSPYGNYILAGPNWGTDNDTQFVLDLNNEDSDWLQSGPGSVIQFVDIREEQP